MASQETLEKLATWCETHWIAPRPMPHVLEDFGAPSVEDCYRALWLRMGRRAAQGDRHIGYKAALTSRAMQQLNNLNEPVMGMLSQSGLYTEEKPISLKTFLHPTLEPEIGVLLEKPLKGPGVNAFDVLHATRGFMPAVELGDMRHGNREGETRGVRQTICCNTFNGGHIFGPVLTLPHQIDTALEGMSLYCDGVLVGSGTGAEVLGHPLNSVAYIANTLATIGQTLEAGMLILTGSIVRSIALSAGQVVRVRFSRLGEVCLRFEA